MDNKKVFYISDNEKIGPISLVDFDQLKLTENTYVWFDGLNDWTEIKNIPELRNRITKDPPPFIPREENHSQMWLAINSNQEAEKNYNTPKEKIKVKNSKKGLRFLIAWTGFHFFAVITSVSKMEFFNDVSPFNYSNETEKFWPFVKVFQYYEQPNRWYGKIRPDARWEFNGLFFQYDWSEFLIYVVGALIIFIFVRVSDIKKENPVANTA